MALYYSSGEEIKTGDRVIYDREEGAVQFVADPSIDPTDWYVTEYGGGVMLTVFGALFVDNPQHDGDLVFVARGPST